MRQRKNRDEGMILPIVLVISMVSAMVVIALANYVTTDLRYGRVVEGRADRLAAADGGLRYGVEQLRNFHGQLGALCGTSAATGGGFTSEFPPMINGADTKVTCRRVGSLISDVDGWGLIVTGEGVPTGQSMFATKGAGQSENVKTFSGPVYIADPTRMDMDALMEIKDGDLYYSSTNCNVPLSIPAIASGYLTFVPDFFRGVECADLPWAGLFRLRLADGSEWVPVPPTTAPLPPVVVNGCTIFSPGKYTSLALGNDNYFKAGEYYFENVNIVVQNATVVAGFPYNAGDSAKINQPACLAAQQDDAFANAISGSGGATFYLGGTSKIHIENGGGFEIFRRLINRDYLSIYALSTSGAGYTASTLDWNDSAGGWVLETKSGSNNDVAVHGLFWAPRAAASLGNITNAANGQLLGGLVVARLDTQASASASAFSIGIETSPRDARYLLSSTATLDGHSTTIQAVVQFRPTSSELAVNSWRVVD